MSGYSDWDLELTSKLEDMDGLLAYLNTKDKDGFNRGGNLLHSDECMARHIWGDHYMYPDEKLYIELAHAVPEAEWNVESLRGEEVASVESFLKVNYERGILTFYRLCDVTSVLPEQFWDRLTYRLWDPVTGKTEQTLLSREDGEPWREIYGNEWQLGNFSYHVFAFCGKPAYADNWDKAIALVQQLGGSVTDKVLEEADYLIYNGEVPDGNHNAALQKAGVYHMNEAQFIDIFVYHHGPFYHASPRELREQCIGFW